MASQTQAPAPTIRNAGTTPARPRKLFVNIPVANVQRSIAFFEELGFTFNRQFTDATAAAMLVGEDAYFMLLEPEKFRGFTRRPVGDPAAQTTSLYAIGVSNRTEVDEMVAKAVASGGSHALAPQDHGFMYGRSFYDPDGHHWEVFWMDPAFVQT
jgi:uncharacterized protein